MVTYDSIKNDPAIREYIKSADESLLALGYTEHSFAHVGMVTSRVEYILSSLDFNKKDIELAKIAASGRRPEIWQSADVARQLDLVLERPARSGA